MDTSLAEALYFINKGDISNEFELEWALSIHRRLRLEPKYKSYRSQLKKLILKYEELKWGKDSIITDEQIKESDEAEKRFLQIICVLNKK